MLTFRALQAVTYTCIVAWDNRWYSDNSYTLYQAYSAMYFQTFTSIHNPHILGSTCIHWYSALLAHCPQSPGSDVPAIYMIIVIHIALIDMGFVWDAIFSAQDKPLDVVIVPAHLYCIPASLNRFTREY